MHAGLLKYLLTKGSEYGPLAARAEVIVSQYISEPVSFTEYGLFWISRVDCKSTVSAEAMFDSATQLRHLAFRTMYS